MALDVPTLLIVYTVNIFAVALALATLLGWRVSLPARCAVGSTVVQALAWACLIASDHWTGQWPDRALSMLSMVGVSAALALLWQAIRLWLGRRGVAPQAAWLLLLMPLAYGLGFDDYPFRVGLANAVLAAQMLLICAEVARPGTTGSGRWRLLVFTCMAMMAVLTAWRGVLGAFFTAEYPSFGAPHPVNVLALLVNNVTVVLTAIGLLVAYREEAETQLRMLAITDGLTQLLNRRTWAERATVLLADARRYGHPVIMLMIDLDHFKEINDQHGHATGDQALQLAARVLREELRHSDLIGRYGGEEFCVLLSHTSEAAARVFDQRLRRRLQRRSMAELGFALDYSVGLAEYRPSDTSLDDLLRRADAALYQAKDAGRGQLIAAV